MQADTANAAAELFGKDHPHLQMPGAWIEIVEIMAIPGMKDDRTTVAGISTSFGEIEFTSVRS